MVCTIQEKGLSGFKYPIPASYYARKIMNELQTHGGLTQNRGTQKKIIQLSFDHFLNETH